MSIRPSLGSARRAVLLTLVLLAGLVPAMPATVSAAKPEGTAGPPRPAVATTSSTARVVSAGNGYTCAVRSDGTAGCWGYEEAGEATPPDGAFITVSAASVHTCAVRVDGTLACWGDASEDKTLPPDGTFTTVSAGWSFTCAIRSDRTLGCWGNNDHFQSTGAPSGEMKVVDAGATHACAVRGDDTLVCWGSNENGRATAPAGTHLSVSSGDAHTCAIRSDGTLACWGFNGGNRSIPPAGTYVALSAGYAHSCAIRSDGTLACWGDNSSSQASPPSGAFKAVSAGVDHTCAIRTDDTVVCWGDDWGGQVTPRPRADIVDLPAWSTDLSLDVAWTGTPALAPVSSFEVRYQRGAWNASLGSPVAWLTGTADTGATLAASPGYSYCFSVRARDADGLFSHWSDDECTALPLDDRSLTRAGSWTIGTDPASYASTVVQSSTAGATLTRAGVAAYQVALLATTCPTCGMVEVSIAGAGTPVRTLSLTSPTTVVSKFLPLFDGNRVNADMIRGTLTIKVVSSGRPVTIDGLLTTRLDLAPSWADVDDPPQPASMKSIHTVDSVSVGYAHSCALKDDGTLTCWGSNLYGRAMPPTGTFTGVSAGTYHSCGIRTDGSLACWGPVTWYGLVDAPAGTFTEVAAGGSSTCAIRTDGTLACWGYDYGDDGEMAVPSGTYTAISAFSLEYGDDYCALRANGTLECWGTDYLYEEATAPTGTFTALGGACGIRTDGSLKCWGWDGLAQATPPAGTFKSVTTGALHACGIRTDDTLACWGDNEYFESTAPGGTFASVDAGAHHTCAVAIDGTLACWGQDRSGQVTPHPVTAMTPLAMWQRSRSVALGWRASALPDLATYDVRYRRAAWNGSFGSATTWRTGLAAPGATFPALAGSTYCYAARAHDADGMVSAWSGETCTAVPLDDRSLTRAGRWTAGTGAAYYNSTYLRSSTAGANLTRTKVVAARIALVATTCPTCGSVKVYWNGTLLKTVSLASATTVNQKLIVIKTWSTAHTGTLKIKVSSSGKRVIIDGVAIRRI